METDKSITTARMTAELRRNLSPIYGDGEARAMIRLIFHSLKGWSQTDMVINADTQLSDYIIDKIKDIKSRLLKNEPIQYILGEAYFYGMNLKVTRDTLIPRPETEQLVDMIVKENNESDLRILDIGTGSGAIAIALSRNLRFAKVAAIDISEGALKVAEENATNLHADISFINCDVFEYSAKPDSFDIIVSNPPYIDDSEKKGMESNVLDYEPHSALFVPDNNPLIFYSKIAELGCKSLSNGGKLYFEINPRHAEELRQLLVDDGYEDVEIISDIYGKQRFIKCSRPNHKS